MKTLAFLLLILGCNNVLAINIPGNISVTDSTSQVNLSYNDLAKAGEIDIPVKLWKFEIRSVGIDITHYDLDVFLMDGFRGSVLGKTGEDQVRVNDMVIRGLIQFETKQGLITYLNSNIIPNLGKKVIVKGQFIPGGYTYLASTSLRKKGDPLDSDLVVKLYINELRGSLD